MIFTVYTQVLFTRLAYHFEALGDEDTIIPNYNLINYHYLSSLVDIRLKVALE